jgi:carbamoyl-phosphate synthase large subunit
LSVDDALKAVENKEIEFPLIVKPRWGMGSIGIFEAEDSTELQIFFKKTKKIIENSYLNYESRNTPDHSVIIQEKLTGEEFGLDIFNNLNGELLSIVPKRKLAIRAGETDIAEIVNDDCLFSIGKQLSYITKHIGNLDVDLFYVNNKFYILELNCRFGGQYPFSHLAGVDFPKALINLLLNTDVPDFLLTAKSEIIGAKDMVPVIINN